MMSIFSARKVTAGVFVLMLASSASLGKAYFEVDDTTYRLGNGFLERVFAKKGDSLSTIWLKNKERDIHGRFDQMNFRCVSHTNG